MKKELVSVEIFRTKNPKNLKKELQELKSLFIEINDLSEPYLIHIRYSEKKLSGEILEPDQINPLDAYELNETISNELKDNLGLNSQIQLSENQANKEINEEAIKIFKKIAYDILKKKNKKNRKNTKNKNNNFEDKDG